MGANTSNLRTVNITNEKPIGVIDASEEVTQRLKAGLVAAREKYRQKENRTDEEPEVQTELRNIAQPRPVSPKTHEPKRKPEEPGDAVMPRLFMEPSLTALEAQKRSEEQLSDNDLYWKERLGTLEQSLNKTNLIMEKEYKRAMNDVKKQFAEAPLQRQLPPCQDLKSDVIRCYQVNYGETLNCSGTVAAFGDCVRAEKLRRIEVRDENNSIVLEPMKVA